MANEPDLMFKTGDEAVRYLASDYVRNLQAENKRLRDVAREAAAFLNTWHPNTERFIEATLPLDAALNRVGLALGEQTVRPETDG